MNRLINALIISLLASVCSALFAIQPQKLPISVHYKHGTAIDAKLNLSYEVGVTSSFSAPYTGSENPNASPRWEVKVIPVTLSATEVEVKVTVLEGGKIVMAPRVKMTVGELTSLALTDATSGQKMTLELNTQNSDGMAPVKTLSYKPRFISENEAVAKIESLTTQIEKEDLRSQTYLDNGLHFVGTEENIERVRARLLEVDVEAQ